MISADRTGMVPVAADGTVFGRDCAYADGSFRVGTKEQNLRLETFDEALAALRAMDVPRWRRPSATTGIPGLVTGVSWIAFPTSGADLAD